MSAISTHVLDAMLGRPAVEIQVVLEQQSPEGWTIVATGSTDLDGRCKGLAPECVKGTYRLTFLVGEYFRTQNRNSIYPEITITFLVDGSGHYHIPVLLSDNSYTTYRGS